MQFQSLETEDEESGDVKYYLTTFVEYTNEKSNKKIKLTLEDNPFHLGVVDSVV